MAVAGVVEFVPPTVTWKVRFVSALTVGAVNVVVGEVGVFSVTAGSVPLLTCVQTNGPVLGVLPAELRVTTVPATMGVAEEVKLATAVAGGGVPPPEPSLVQVRLGAGDPGQGFSCPIG